MNNPLGFHCNAIGHIQTRLLSNGLKRGEFYNFPAQDLTELRRLISRHELSFSVHTPLARTPWYPDPPTWSFLCDAEEEKRNLNFRLVEETLQTAQDWGAEYVVVHFPSPPTTNSVDAANLQRVADQSAGNLARLGAQYGLPIHVEGFGPSPLLSAGFLKDVFARHTGLKYCFDTGHMNLASKRDGIDIYRFAEEMAPHIGSMHLWNNRGFSDYQAFRHVPVHPSQNPQEGWADVGRLVKSVIGHNDACVLTIESSDVYPAELGGYDYRDGIEWLRQLLTI